jgi:hypothetical protein
MKPILFCFEEALAESQTISRLSLSQPFPQGRAGDVKGLHVSLARLLK